VKKFLWRKLLWKKENFENWITSLRISIPTASKNAPKFGKQSEVFATEFVKNMYDLGMKAMAKDVDYRPALITEDLSK